MAPVIQEIQTKGIHHGLPVFSKDLKDLTAIVTGTSGISGSHMARILAESPERWSKIYCLSRRPPAFPSGLPSNVEHVSCDFLQEPEKVAQDLKAQVTKVDYVFYFTYAEPPEGQTNPQKLTDVNVALLENFLQSLKLADLKPKTVLLQTGGKYYGIHQGPAKQPAEEFHPRISIASQPNFYYAQEDLLRSHCSATSPPTNWAITMPGPIIGAVCNPFMNFVYPLALYASACAHLDQPLIFPGGISAWRTSWTISSAKLNSYLNEWAILNPAAQNQRFNTADGSTFTMESFWPKLAGWFGLEWDAPVVFGKENAVVMDVPGFATPGPRGYGPTSRLEFCFMFSQWAAEKDFPRVWREITEKYGLVEREFQVEELSRVFQLIDFALVDEQILLSMNKARGMGWCGFVDSAESVEEVLQEFVDLGMIPPMIGRKTIHTGQET